MVEITQELLEKRLDQLLAEESQLRAQAEANLNAYNGAIQEIEKLLSHFNSVKAPTGDAGACEASVMIQNNVNDGENIE
jgi:hypothetical protein